MSVTFPQGFRATGVTAGLKASGRPDLAVVINNGPRFDAAGVFTRNRIQAAPVIWSKQVLADGQLHAVVLNSGGANACTGPEGFADTHHTAEAAAADLGIGPIDVAICSTGLIGERLDMGRLLAGLKYAIASANAQGGNDAAAAIMTTDTAAKTAVAQSVAGYSIGGMAKGAGMLAPGMATMLCVITTDAVADAATLDSALRAATAATIDRVDSDGCMSTNDTVILMASGASGKPADDDFAAHLHAVCASLARQLAADAEGASKLIDIHVVNAATEHEAVDASAGRWPAAPCSSARCSARTRTGAGCLSAVGTTDAAFDPAAHRRHHQRCSGLPGLRRRGLRATSWTCKPREVTVEIDLHAGDAHATITTTDLTHDYVHENSAYST